MYFLQEVLQMLFQDSLAFLSVVNSKTNFIKSTFNDHLKNTSKHICLHIKCTIIQICVGPSNVSNDYLQKRYDLNRFFAFLCMNISFVSAPKFSGKKITSLGSQSSIEPTFLCCYLLIFTFCVQSLMSYSLYIIISQVSYDEKYKHTSVYYFTYDMTVRHISAFHFLECEHKTLIISKVYKVNPST